MSLKEIRLRHAKTLVLAKSEAEKVVGPFLYVPLLKRTGSIFGAATFPLYQLHHHHSDRFRQTGLFFMRWRLNPSAAHPQGSSRCVRADNVSRNTWRL